MLSYIIQFSKWFASKLFKLYLFVVFILSFGDVCHYALNTVSKHKLIHEILTNLIFFVL